MVEQYNNNNYYSINKKHINVDYSALTKKIETNPKAPKFKVNDRVREWESIIIFLVKVIIKIGQEKYLSVWETHPWTHQIKHFNGEKVIGKFYEKELL